MGKKRLETRQRGDPERVRGISQGWYYILKYIAIFSMLSDHLGKVLLSVGVINESRYLPFTIAGRLAFPLFAFMLVESFHFTRNKQKHLLQIGVLFLISELPFDMAMVMSHPLLFDETALMIQNTCLTLFLGFLMLAITNADWNNALKKIYPNGSIRKFITRILPVGILGIFLILSIVTECDYSWRGILLIALFQFARNRKHMKFWQFVSLVIFVLSTGSHITIFTAALLSLFPIYFAESNIKIGEKSERCITKKGSKIFCRFFYPAHLVVLTVLKIILVL